jgi:hypothetical protein
LELHGGGMVSPLTLPGHRAKVVCDRPKQAVLRDTLAKPL